MEPKDKNLWDAYLTQRENSSIYQLYDWRTVFENTYGCQTFYLAAWEGDRIVGVLPLFLVRRFGLGSYVSSLPGGIQANDGKIAQALLETGISLTREYRAHYFKLRDSSMSWPDERLKTQVEYTYIVELIGCSDEQLWETLRSEVRSRIRQALKHRLKVEVGTEYLRDFYDVYTTNMRDLGSPAVPWAFFENCAARFSDKMKILVVRRDAGVIGGMMLFLHGHTVVNPFVSSLRSYFAYCPNDLLYWEALRYALRTGFQALDLGRSEKDSGVARFKMKWSAKPEPLFYQYFLNGTRRIPNVRKDIRYRWVSPIWRRLPLPVANRLGWWVRRYMPLA